jgi:hypothetical protein
LLRELLARADYSTRRLDQHVAPGVRPRANALKNNCSQISLV